jgi:hypothetical protein
MTPRCRCSFQATHERTARWWSTFFRREFGWLVAVLTRSLGVRRLDVVEDVAQAASRLIGEDVAGRKSSAYNRVQVSLGVSVVTRAESRPWDRSG